jgi:hypothetical protein
LERILLNQNPFPIVSHSVDGPSAKNRFTLRLLVPANPCINFWKTPSIGALAGTIRSTVC